VLPEKRKRQRARLAQSPPERPAKPGRCGRRHHVDELLGAQSADADYKNWTVPFLQGLKETSYVEDQNVAIEHRWAENQYDRLPTLAADLVRRRVAVIVASSTEAALVSKSATTTIPIVFSTGGDPVALGLVATGPAQATGALDLAVEVVELKIVDRASDSKIGRILHEGT
jgi:hypothetical protein